MEIYQLRAMLAIARTGNLTRAAQHLHLTQPAVSKQLKALEEELGVQLFHRNSNGMLLSKSGRLLLPHAEKTLACAMELRSHAKALQGKRAGELRIGTIIDPPSLRLGSFLSALVLNHALLNVKLLHGISGWVMERLLHGDIDLGFYLGRVQEKGVASRLLHMETYRIVAPRHWADRLKGASLTDLAGMP